jgi:5-formyltetrahydrofolate cyclo-ligase
MKASRAHSLPPEEQIRQRVKAELRKRMRGVRKTTPAEACAERSSRIVARLLDHKLLVHAKSVALFWPMLERHEVDLRALDSALRARGVSTAYPAIDPETNAMVFRFVSAPEELCEAGFGFLEPPRDAPIAARGALDLVIVPALAVDPSGHRIGYGAGYYDRTLPEVAPPAASLAVAYDWQLVAEVPATSTDVRVGFIVTDAREIDVSEG